MENEAIHSKIKANAVSAYLLLFVSIFFLFNKDNKYLNNNFVKSHVKTAFSIHILFLITYIVFISIGFLNWIPLFELSVGDIIAKIIFFILLGWLLTGVYKAHIWEVFNAFDILQFTKNSQENIIDINGDGKFWEKDKMTILLSYIPFIWFLNYPKYKENNIIRNNIKLNLTITIIIFLLYIYSHYNIANILLLFYTISIVFIGITMFSRDQIISLNLSKIPTFKELSYIIKSLWEYIKSYFSDKDLTSIHNIVERKINEDINKEKQELKDLENKKISRLPSFLIYIPYINLIFLFIKNTKYTYHIRNGLTITSLLILLQIVAYFWYYESSLNRMVLIPILFWIWFSRNEPVYKMALIYDIYEWFQKFIAIISLQTKKANQIRKTETKVSLKVK